jgi:hypothetical protein
MRELLETIFPYLVILYLIDGIAHVSTHHLLFVSYSGARFKLVKSGAFFINLLPLGRIIASHSLPICFSCKGVYFLTSARRYETALYHLDDFYCLPYRDMETIEADGKEVKVNGERLVKAPSSISTKQLAGLLQELVALKPGQRRERIQAFLAETTDLQGVVALHKAYSFPFQCLMLLCSFLFILTFVVLPLALYLELGWSLNLFHLILIITLIYVLILGLSYALLGRAYRNDAGMIFQELLSIALLPVSAIQALSHLTKNIYAEFDYLATAGALLPPDRFRGLIRKELYRVKHAKGQNSDPDWAEFWGFRENALHRLIAQSDLTLSEVLAPPEKQDATAASYCPMCWAEYLAGFERCSECDVLLIEFKPSRLESRL